GPHIPRARQPCNATGPTASPTRELAPRPWLPVAGEVRTTADHRLALGSVVRGIAPGSADLRATPDQQNPLDHSDNMFELMMITRSSLTGRPGQPARTVTWSTK